MRTLSDLPDWLADATFRLSVWLGVALVGVVIALVKMVCLVMVSALSRAPIMIQPYLPR